MKHFLAVAAILFIFQTHASGFEESAKVGEIFKSAGMNGTFVLYYVTAHTYTGHNKDRAEKRFVPASTFKIPNSLIGLSVGAVKGVDEVLPYRGGIRNPSPKLGKRTWG